ncbi:MAG: hypothetical protein K2W96_08780 [Gemmataceae bacterium]|nr:hypothetical protein [Gemmataceae bacterium]
MDTPLRLLAHDPQPLEWIDYLNAASGGLRTEVRHVEVTVATVAALPDDLDALVLSADLQGRERIAPRAGEGKLGREGTRLLGEVVAERLHGMAEAGRLPPADRTGVLLAGDLWAEPGSTRRGGEGDVAVVYQAFAQRFRWVAGVLGNHDELHGPPGAGCLLLDGRVVDLDGLKVGGVGGIIGNPRKLNRKTADEFDSLLSRVLVQRPHVVLLHAGPDDPAEDRKGSALARECLERHARTLCVFGHCHWDEPMGAMDNGGQLVNVDGRVIVLKRAG